MKYLTRKYQLHRIAVILCFGLIGALIVRARNHIEQEPKVDAKPAPELVGDKWLNTSRPITLASRKGKVTMVEFWTFACSNCQANLPTYEAWQEQFQSAGFSIIAIHTPELPEEFKTDAVKKFLVAHNIKYPVLLDSEYKNWSRWNQEYWPAIYLVDKRGLIRDVWLGELGSSKDKVEAKIRRLLAE